MNSALSKSCFSSLADRSKSCGSVRLSPAQNAQLSWSLQYGRLKNLGG